jgi:hypothetical protein
MSKISYARHRFDGIGSALIEMDDVLTHALVPLLDARLVLHQHFLELDRRVKGAATHDEVCMRMMTVPSVRPIAALTFKSAIDDPTRFRRSRTVAAHFGFGCRSTLLMRHKGSMRPLRYFANFRLFSRGAPVITGMHFKWSVHMPSPTHLRQNQSHSTVLLCAIGLVAGAIGLFNPHGAEAQMHGQGAGAGMHGHGADGTGHDEVIMPGLRGLNATAAESTELAVMFRNFETISREVTNLPDGIRTVTRSSDEEVMEILISHVVGMIGRVEQKDDPQIFIQSPTLDIFFDLGDQIDTTIDVTDEGIAVVQTSEDPELVAALQLHASEVTAMVERGMQAVHEMMMSRPVN